VEREDSNPRPGIMSANRPPKAPLATRDRPYAAPASIGGPSDRTGTGTDDDHEPDDRAGLPWKCAHNSPTWRLRAWLAGWFRRDAMTSYRAARDAADRQLRLCVPGRRGVGAQSPIRLGPHSGQQILRQQDRMQSSSGPLVVRESLDDPYRDQSNALMGFIIATVKKEQRRAPGERSCHEGIHGCAGPLHAAFEAPEPDSA